MIPIRVIFHNTQENLFELQHLDLDLWLFLLFLLNCVEILA